MKLVTAVVKPERLDDVMHAVAATGAGGLTATDVRGYGQQCGHMRAVAPAGWQATPLPKLISPVSAAIRVRTGERDESAV
jgi:nitrogen regulatory protein P-II 2